MARVARKVGNAALENVAKLSPHQLPELPHKPNAPESWRRLTALHRELSRLCDWKVHFLSYRDAAKVFDRMSCQEAHTITGALETLGAIKIVSKGKPGLNSNQAAQFRYLLEVRRKERRRRIGAIVRPIRGGRYHKAPSENALRLTRQASALRLLSQNKRFHVRAALSASQLFIPRTSSLAPGR